jgi:hypothetical protein
MRCPHCLSTATTERSDRTELGYRRFRCRDGGHVFNERTGTPFNRLQYPTDVVSLVVFWRFRYKLSVRDLAEMFLQRGHLDDLAGGSARQPKRQKESGAAPAADGEDVAGSPRK